MFTRTCSDATSLPWDSNNEPHTHPHKELLLGECYLDSTRTNRSPIARVQDVEVINTAKTISFRRYRTVPHMHCSNSSNQLNVFNLPSPPKPWCPAPIRQYPPPPHSTYGKRRVDSRANGTVEVNKTAHSETRSLSQLKGRAPLSRSSLLAIYFHVREMRFQTFLKALDSLLLFNFLVQQIDKNNDRVTTDTHPTQM